MYFLGLLDPEMKKIFMFKVSKRFIIYQQSYTQ